MTKVKNYGNESIVSLKGADRVRKRPSVIFGSDGIEGCRHSFFEILSNAIDEAREGFGDKIEIIRHKDHSITVQDWASGIPVDYNPKEGRYNWELVFCELYAGGKYKNNDGSHYEYSLGLNGLGSCATQYSSEYMTVEVVRDGYVYNLSFEKGVNIGGLLKTENTKKRPSGSIIKWRPDLDVFTDINISLEYFQDVLKKQAIVNKGLKFILLDEETNISYEYYYENGIMDYLDEVDDGKNFTNIQFFESEGKGKDRDDKDEYKVKAQIAFAFNNEINLLEYYHNSSYLEYGGAPDKAVRSAFVSAIDQYIKKENKYNKNEKKVSFIDVQDSLVLVINSFSTVTSYENQTKKAITNKFIQQFLTNFIKHELEIYFIENKMEANRIAEQMLANKRSREKAEKTRINIRKKLTGKVDLNNRVKKFVGCRTKDISKRELYIVEGDSALGACKLARDAEFQGLMPIRGKILNCLKSDYDKIFKSDIIVDLLKVMGCGVEINSRHNKELSTFDINLLKWDRIIICTDADVDGFQIRTLILTMLHRLVPSLIEEGKVYIVESPLYEITTSKKTYFAYSDKEKNQIIDKLNVKYKLQRSKGLGENEPDMMWQTTMNPETRKLIQVMIGDLTEAQEMFDVLLGENLQGRKDFIEMHGERYLDVLDIS